MTGITITHRDQFAFMAWRRNPERDPSFRLQTEAEALDEAKRLATKRPGSTYIVLREIARVTIPAAVPPRQSVEPGGILPPLPSGSKNIDKANKEREFVTGDDGYIVYWPKGCAGFFDAITLRAFADQLDRLNACWDEQVQNDMRGTHNDQLPCDVKLPPATIIAAGCSFDTLRLAMSLPGRPRHFDENRHLGAKHPAGKRSHSP